MSKTLDGDMYEVKETLPLSQIIETIVDNIFKFSKPYVKKIISAPLKHKINIDPIYEIFKRLEDLHEDLNIVKLPVPGIKVNYQDEYIGMVMIDIPHKEIVLWKEVYLPCKDYSGKPMRIRQTITLFEFLIAILPADSDIIKYKLEKIGLSCT